MLFVPWEYANKVLKIINYVSANKLSDELAYFYFILQEWVVHIDIRMEILI